MPDAADKPPAEAGATPEARRAQFLERERVWDFLIERPSRAELVDTDHGYILYIEELTVSFDGFKALDNLTLYIETGELRCIIGPNGAGKTTMMDVITGKTRPDYGSVFYGQRLDLTRLPEAEIATLGIGRKFQKPTVFESHTPYQNLELAMAADKRVWPTLLRRLSGEERDRIEEVLGTVGLGTHAVAGADTLAGALSHGEKQWLEIGMLLMQNPLVLLVDEPVAGMTRQESELTGELLVSLAGEHSVIVVEHDMDFVRSIARQVTVLHEGRVLAEGSFDAVQDDARVREKMYRAYSRRAADGKFDNTGNILRILALRKEKAQLLGFADFSDLVLEDRMAKSGARAWNFVNDLRDRTLAAFSDENQELESFAGTGVLPWDLAYQAEKLRKERYDFDEEDLRPYFPYGGVLEGMFDVAQRLFGIQIEEREDMPVWDATVKTYRINDADGSHLGSFYADYFPRENKRGGAWMNDLITGEPTGDSFSPHLGVNCGNLTPPSGGKPALLTHGEVETIFHEFGHLLHHLLSRVEVKWLAGTNVAGEWMELPSQIMENWCWEREALDLFARHHETGEPIPDDLFEKMRRAKNFRSANAQMRQLGFGTLDLALHTNFAPDRDGDAIAYSRKILQSHSPAELPADYSMVTGFTHLFARPVGYGSGYYSYKWSEMLDADAFTRFAKEGIFNSETGGAFRRIILERGNSAEPEDLFRSFMGRDPDPEALLRRLGLAA